MFGTVVACHFFHEEVVNVSWSGSTGGQCVNSIHHVRKCAPIALERLIFHPDSMRRGTRYHCCYCRDYDAFGSRPRSHLFLSLPRVRRAPLDILHTVLLFHYTLHPPCTYFEAAYPCSFWYPRSTTSAHHGKRNKSACIMMCFASAHIIDGYIPKYIGLSHGVS